MTKKRNKAGTSTIFDFLKYLTYEKRPWEDLSDGDKKAFSPYLINRWLSMNMELIDIVNEFQHLTIGNLDKREVYKLYYDFLPRRKFFSKYVKSKRKKPNSELVDLVCKFYDISARESVDYIEFYKSKPDGINTLKMICSQYGMEDKQILKLIK